MKLSRTPETCLEKRASGDAAQTSACYELCKGWFEFGSLGLASEHPLLRESDDVEYEDDTNWLCQCTGPQGRKLVDAALRQLDYETFPNGAEEFQTAAATLLGCEFVGCSDGHPN
jgi:hypothetical protein